MEERVPVVRAADRLDDEHDAARNLAGRAAGAGGLRRPRLDVEVDVLLGLQLDPQPGERAFECGQHQVPWKAGVPFACPEEARHAPALRLLERDADPAPDEAGPP